MKNLSIMKKSFTMSVAMLVLLLVSVSVNAQHQNPPSDPVGDSAHMQQELLKHDPEMKYDDEVPADEINPAVSSAIVEAYPDYGIAKIYQARDGSYKVKLEKADEIITVYYSINGELLKEGKDEDEKEKK